MEPTNIPNTPSPVSTSGALTSGNAGAGSTSETEASALGRVFFSLLNRVMDKARENGNTGA